MVAVAPGAAVVAAGASVAAAVAPAAAAREADGERTDHVLGLLERLPRLLDVDRVKRAIVDVEKGTSGEVRVSLCPFFWGSVQRAAERAFTRLRMQQTRHRNGVLIFIEPSRHAFVVLGDVGIHQRVGDELWNRLVREISPYFRSGDLTSGVLHGIELIGNELARHFPPDPPGSPNELADEVDVGRP
jgi:uncharacterized membrane protein